jgi:hypothetical protein
LLLLLLLLKLAVSSNKCDVLRDDAVPVELDRTLPELPQIEGEGVMMSQGSCLL